MRTNGYRKSFWLLIPAIGVLLFIILYAIATYLYPGGSKVNPRSVGFDWLNNYWCDLTSERAKNGAVNPARPIALIAMLVLCFSLSFFWFQMPRLFLKRRYRHFIRYTGISSMVVSVFLFTGFHDVVINVAGALGMVALLTAFYALYKNGYKMFFGFGITCMALMLLNYFIYNTGIGLPYLAVIQKVTFVVFLSWVCMLTVQLYRKKVYDINHS